MPSCDARPPRPERPPGAPLAVIAAFVALSGCGPRRTTTTPTAAGDADGGALEAVTPDREGPPIAILRDGRPRGDEVLVDRAGGRLYAVVPPSLTPTPPKGPPPPFERALVAIDLTTGRERWRVPAPEHAAQWTWPLRVDGEHLLGAEARGAALELWARDAATGALAWRRPVALPREVGPMRGFGTDFDVRVERNPEGLLACWAWSSAPVYATPPPPGADRSRRYAGGAAWIRDAELAPTTRACSAEVLTLPADAKRLVRTPREWLCSGAAEVGGAMVVAVCGPSNALLRVRPFAATEREELKGVTSRPGLTAGGLLVVPDARGERVDVLELDGTRLAQLPLVRQDLGERDDPHGQAGHALDRTTIARVAGGLLTEWRPGAQSRGARVLILYGPDGSERWRLATEDAQSRVVPPP